MPKLKNKKKCYVILGAKNFTYGAFPHTPQGHEDAKKYVRKLKKTHECDFKIEEK
jgi:hypothetical protein